jgi:ketosteroid isomerase-like protein
MADRDEIERLIKLYGYVVDDREWDRLGEIFAEDASFVVAGTDIAVDGFAAIDTFMRTYPHPLAHYSTNILIDVEEGADTARAAVKIWAPRADGTALIGKYLDEIVRTPKGWRFRCRHVVVTERRWVSAAQA